MSNEGISTLAAVTSGSVSTNTYKNSSFYCNWQRESYNETENYSVINWQAGLYISKSDEWYSNAIKINNLTINGEVVASDVVASNKSGTGTYQLASGKLTIHHDSDGSKTFSISMTCWLYGDHDLSGNESFELPNIPRYAKFTEHNVKSTGLDTIIVHWDANSNCDAVQYSLNGAAWVSTSGNDYTISGLNYNTQYSIKTRIRRADSQLWTESEIIYGTTKDIAKMTVDNFEHGSSISIVITNPSGSSLNLVMKIGNTQIFSKNINSETNTINFSDAELDSIYKLYGSGNTLTATFILTTASKYTNTKTCTITLKGNQKTIRNNASGTWKRGKIWTNINGTWKRAVVWVNISGSWRRCI